LLSIEAVVNVLSSISFQLVFLFFGFPSNGGPLKKIIQKKKISTGKTMSSEARKDDPEMDILWALEHDSV